MPPNVIIKGIREGLLVSFGEGSWLEIHQALLEHLDQQAEFLKGGRLAIDLGNRSLKAVELSQLRNEISERGLTLWAILSESPATEKNAQTLGLVTQIERGRHWAGSGAKEMSVLYGEEAVMVRRTLRSGVRVHFPGHVIIMGDVNPGAEIVAGGDVVVWGRLRGMVHAGAQGNETAVVCALDLSPTQLRIAGQIALTPKRRGKPQPERAQLKDGQVVAEIWDPKKREIL